MLRTRIREFISAAIIQLQAEGALPKFDVPDFAVESPEDSAHGDYATNVAMAVAKVAKARPAEIAGALASKLRDKKLFSSIKIVPPGFVNFQISDGSIREAFTSTLANPDEWGKSDVGKGKTAIVEYFQLNIAKRPHIGHLRSAVIGDAIKRLLQSRGYRTISDTHVGDWGTQFGILLLGCKDFFAEVGAKGAVSGRPFDFYEDIYAKENTRIVEDPQRRELAKEEFAKLERAKLKKTKGLRLDGAEKQNIEIWKNIVEQSMFALKASAERLGLLPFDEHRGESAYEQDMPTIVEDALSKGIAKKTSDRAVVVDLSADGLDEAVLLKSDGASTYLLRDLATIRYRKQQYDFWKNIYVVDVRQSHHFKQVFRVAELLGFEGVGESRHIEFGFMTLPEGPMSTRKGTAVSLGGLVAEAWKRANDIILEKNPHLEGRATIAQQVGVGALKYFDLSHHRRSDIVFRWEEALSFDGNAGPYLQYTHARLKSILRKAAELTRNSDAELMRNFSAGVTLDDVEHRLLVAALRLPEAIEDALADFAPNLLANYLYNLAKLANEFYHSHPVIQEQDESKREVRLALVTGTALTLARGLNLLGIAAPEEM